MQERAVMVYTKPTGCGKCIATKRRLDGAGITYTAVDITTDEDSRAYALGLGHQEAPVVVLDDGTHWSGYRPDLIDQIKEHPNA